MISEAFNMDCMEGMKNYPDKYFELAIVDPPYGIDIMHAGGYPESQAFIKWDRKSWDVSTPQLEYFSELRRISQNQIIWGGNHFCDYLGSFHTCVIWDKMQRDFTNSDFELAWTSFNKKNKAFSLSRVQAYTNQNKIHPTQKPVKLYKWLLKNYANPGDKILDTHLGSGSSRIAAYSMGFDFTGYEIDKEYFDKQERRFADFKKQLTLFS